jgi:riboflavin transporter FmnP
MKTAALASIIVFAALTVILNPSITGIGVPAPYLPFLVYQIWEIPIVAIFLLYGPKYGITVGVLNSFVLLAIFMGPGGLPAAPFYNLIANLSMMLGVYIPHVFSNLRTRHLRTDQVASSPKHGALLITASTILGITLRVIVMTLVNFSVLGFGYPLGYNMPQAAIIPILPLIALFNATLALYTIPFGYFLAEVVRSRLKLNNPS